MSTEVDLKARELVDKFKVYAHAHWDEKYGFDEVNLLDNAKKCALIAVNEILSLKMIYNMSRNDKYSESEFYELVEEKIKTL